MAHVYFARHGQTIWNVENKICGATDIALTELGHEQARLLGKKIVDEGLCIDEILYSPLIRAKDTALEIAAVTGIPAREEGRLREQDFGKYESTPRNGAEFQEAKRSFVNHFGSGETMLHLAQRIYNLLDEIKADPGQKTYLLVAHNGIARVVHSYFNDMTGGIGFFRFLEECARSFDTKKAEIIAGLKRVIEKLLCRENMTVSYTAQEE